MWRGVIPERAWEEHTLGPIALPVWLFMLQSSPPALRRPLKQLLPNELGEKSRLLEDVTAAGVSLRKAQSSFGRVF